MEIQSTRTANDGTAEVIEYWKFTLTARKKFKLRLEDVLKWCFVRLIYTDNYLITLVLQLSLRIFSMLKRGEIEMMYRGKSTRIILFIIMR